jgi:hypothetical protein
MENAVLLPYFKKKKECRARVDGEGRPPGAERWSHATRLPALLITDCPL